MTEYLSDAIVLRRDAYAEKDNRFSFFTKRYGKLVAKGRSTRKITSKLSGHLQEGNLVRARLIEKNGLQVVDALKTEAMQIPHHSLFTLDELLAEGEPDEGLWQLLTEGNFNWTQTLRLLGWDPEESTCRSCERKTPDYFMPKTQEFVCGPCVHTFRMSQSTVVYIK